MYWTDAALSTKEIRDIPQHIRVNHFAEITNLTRKNKMAIALNSMLRFFPKVIEYFILGIWFLSGDLYVAYGLQHFAEKTVSKR